jgi:hypothetical protein
MNENDESLDKKMIKGYYRIKNYMKIRDSE